MKRFYISLSQKGAIKCIPVILLLLVSVGCEDFLEPDYPFDQVAHQEVFENEATATAAITTLYGKLRDEVFLTGTLYGQSFLMGIYTDELVLYGSSGQPIETFYNHQILASNDIVRQLWASAYRLIYMCNAALEGLQASTTLSVTYKNQLMGEAMFVRALTYSYLAGLFGDIPLVTTTDYQTNSSVSRTAVDDIYAFLIGDLVEAKSLLGETYVSGERTRANRWVVSALLARVYKNTQNWQLAEAESTTVINNTTLYVLEPNLDDEFLKNSRSALLQLKPKNEGANTKEAGTFIFTSGPPPVAALHENLIAAMEVQDLRRTHWVGEVTDGTNTWYHPYKYKVSNNTSMSVEYAIAIRLPESYLIRAEARARQGNITGAQEDLNAIRARAGLNPTTASSLADLLDAVVNEKRIEFFTEHGHRWFDLKHFDRADEVLSPLKPGWSPTNILLPVPESDLLMNPNLNPQNPGY